MKAARQIIGRRLGRYEVLTQLASGGMATVYIARATGVAGFERLVAIKMLHPHLAYEEEFIHMFLDEARLAARIRHPNVVATTDISDTEGDGFFLVMDYIEGGHLGSLLAAAGRNQERLPAEVVVRVLLDSLAGLGAAHELTDDLGQRLELVHRDVSPQNIMVGVDGIGRLTDFGVAKAEKRLTSTRGNQLKGKLAYMSPEQASSGFADQRSDLFSMGIILWESLTGRRLFRGENNAATLSKILMEPVPPVSAFAPEQRHYDAVVRKALLRDADARFQTAEEFGAALREAADNKVAGPREVGDEVKLRLEKRLEEQRAEVRSAIERLGRASLAGDGVVYDEASGTYSVRRPGSSEVTPIPSRPDSTPKSIPAPSETPSLSSLELSLAEEEEPKRWLWIGGLVLLLAAGVGIALGVINREEEEPPPIAPVHTTMPEHDSSSLMAQPLAPPEEPEVREETPEEAPEVVEEPTSERVGQSRHSMRRTPTMRQEAPTMSATSATNTSTSTSATNTSAMATEMTEETTPATMEETRSTMSAVPLPDLNPYRQ